MTIDQEKVGEAAAELIKGEYAKSSAILAAVAAAALTGSPLLAGAVGGTVQAFAALLAQSATKRMLEAEQQWDNREEVVSRIVIELERGLAEIHHSQWQPIWERISGSLDILVDEQCELFVRLCRFISREVASASDEGRPLLTAIADAQARAESRQVALARAVQGIHEDVAVLRRTTTELVTARSYSSGAASAAGHTTLFPVALGDLLGPEFGANVDSVRELLRRDLASTALDQARALKSRIWDRADPSVRTRLSGLIGLIQMELGNVDQAAQELLRSIEHDPDSPKAWSHAALAHFLRSNNTAALTWAHRAFERDHHNVLAAQITVLAGDLPDEELLAQTDPTVGPNADIFSALGQRAVSREDVPRALHWSEAALALKPDSRVLQATVAENTIFRLTQIEAKNGQLTSSERTRARKAGDLLYHYWSHLELPLQRSRVSWLRAAALAANLLGEEAALERTERLVGVAADNLDFVRLRVGALLAHDKLEDAQALLSSQAQVEPGDSALLAMVRAKQGDLAAAADQWWLLLQQHELPVELRNDIERNYVIALLEQGRQSDAWHFTVELLQRTPLDVPRLLNAARVAENTDAIDQLAQLLDRAQGMEIQSDNTNPHWVLRLADLLARHEEYDAAAIRYESVLDLNEDSFYTRRYVDTLVSAQRFNTALQVADRLAHQDPFYAHVQCIVHERLGNLPLVISLCEGILSRSPDESQSRLRLAISCFRQGQATRAEAEIRRVSIDWSASRLHYAKAHAHLLEALGDKGTALELLYRMRAQHPEDADAHLTYISQYLSLKDREDTPARATAETAVLLEGVGAPGWVLLTNSEHESLERKAYPTSHPLARALIGKCVGDEVSFGGMSNPWTLKDIATNYAFAFIESGNLFPARFPTARGFWQRRLAKEPEDLVKQMQEFVKPGHDRAEMVTAAYAQGRGCVGTVARLLKCTAIEALGTVLNAPGGLHAFSNSPDERLNAASLLAKADVTLVIDLTAIMLSDDLGLLRNKLLDSFDLLIAQSTIDELEQLCLQWMVKRNEGAFGIGLERGTLVKYETSRERACQTFEHFTRLVEWLRENCQVRGVSPSLAETTRMKPDPRAGVGDSFWDTALIAKEAGIMLSDDLRFRVLVRGGLGVESVCTATLISALVNRGALDEAAADENVLKLLRMGYRSLPVSANTLVAAARLDDWKAGSHFTSAVRMLEGPRTIEGSALHVAAQFLKQIWLLPTFSQSQASLLFPLLDAIIVGRHVSSVLKRFHLIVSQALQVLPLVERDVEKLIQLWKLQRAPRL